MSTPAPSPRELLAANLRRLRRAAGLTQLQLAARAALRNDHISRIEHAKANPLLSTLDALADALGVQTVDLLRP